MPATWTSAFRWHAWEIMIAGAIGALAGLFILASDPTTAIGCIGFFGGGGLVGYSYLMPRVRFETSGGENVLRVNRSALTLRAFAAAVTSLGIILLGGRFTFEPLATLTAYAFGGIGLITAAVLASKLNLPTIAVFDAHGVRSPAEGWSIAWRDVSGVTLRLAGRVYWLVLLSAHGPPTSTGERAFEICLDERSHLVEPVRLQAYARWAFRNG